MFALCSDDAQIYLFLKMDFCCKVSDKYLLAMTYIYFMRARLPLTRMNFFVALYLANIMEEEEWRNRFEIFRWALGEHWRSQFRGFLQQKDQLWESMDYRAAVNRRCCEEVMAIAPSHSLWKRERNEYHSGAQRRYSGEGYLVPLASASTAIPCTLCSRRALQTQEPHTSDHTGSSAFSAQNRGSEQKGSLVQISEERRGSKRMRDGQLKDRGSCADPCKDPFARFDASGSPQDFGSLSVAGAMM
ncbi:speedy protein A-like isoform X2 [Brienomyrus brachyistius]|uniref:speedy protein A-like isoform X2 n=1 Tax=Brienomyrus brachyistius TaxID=42636 RepID=UPI0020B34F3B|nr:speedy protein A-like isoform X2 [Brienomyrus brachyistius]